MHFEAVRTATPELWEAMKRLLPQLSASAAVPDVGELEALMREGSSRLVIAREPDGGGPIVAMGTLGTFRTPTGVRAVIEDVVVDRSFRGRGVGEALLRSLLELARAKGARGVALTSNPQRVSANRLYLRMGFRRRRRNSYFYDLA